MGYMHNVWGSPKWEVLEHCQTHFQERRTLFFCSSLDLSHGLNHIDVFFVGAETTLFVRAGRVYSDKVSRQLRRAIARIFPIMGRRESTVFAQMLLYSFLKMVAIFTSFRSHGTLFFSQTRRRRKRRSKRRREKILDLGGNTPCLISSIPYYQYPGL